MDASNATLGLGISYNFWTPAGHTVSLVKSGQVYVFGVLTYSLVKSPLISKFVDIGVTGTAKVSSLAAAAGGLAFSARGGCNQQVTGRIVDARFTNCVHFQALVNWDPNGDGTTNGDFAVIVRIADLDAMPAATANLAHQRPPASAGSRHYCALPQTAQRQSDARRLQARLCVRHYLYSLQKQQRLCGLHRLDGNHRQPARCSNIYD